jgi:hypothetical protein
MTLNTIYIKFQIPPNLQRHMLEVAAVCILILDNWTGEKVDRQLTVQSALLHDLGNLVKFKRPFMGELEVEAEHWQAVQDDLISRYGTDAKNATHQMIAEIGLKNSIGKVLKDVDKLVEGIELMKPEAQIVEFADFCVSPEGIVGYQRRKKDLINRYGAKHGLSWVAPADRFMVAIQQKVNVDLKTIDNIDFTNYHKHLPNYLTNELV